MLKGTSFCYFITFLVLSNLTQITVIFLGLFHVRIKVSNTESLFCRLDFLCTPRRILGLLKKKEFFSLNKRMPLNLLCHVHLPKFSCILMRHSIQRVFCFNEAHLKRHVVFAKNVLSPLQISYIYNVHKLSHQQRQNFSCTVAVSSKFMGN